MKKAWTDAGLDYLGAVALDSYGLMSKTPIKSVGDLKGKKIGAVGINQAWISNTGADCRRSQL